MTFLCIFIHKHKNTERQTENTQEKTAQKVLARWHLPHTYTCSEMSTFNQRKINGNLYTTHSLALVLTTKLKRTQALKHF